MRDTLARSNDDGASSCNQRSKAATSVGVIEALEAERGRPVLTANQVLLWAAPRAAGAPASSVAGCGRIFAVGGA
jgi:maleate isomerase